ncbi:MAG: UPF0182 family protein, partial [Chloroflexi bacterium]|nr:UPF0182 family protein [Chloroflexota bacterium]
MSFIDQFERAPQASKLPILRWAVPLGAVVALWALGTVGAGIFTDWLWFDQLGFLSVYTKILTMKLVLFVGGGILFLVLFVPNVYFASRFSPHGVAPEAAVNIPAEALMWARRLVTVGIVVGALLLAIIFGAAAAGSWEVALRFTNAVSFGIVDPQFGRDASYYVFSLPFYRFAQGWLLGIFVVNTLVVLGIYAINFAIGGFQFRVTPALRGHLSALGAAVFLMLAAGYWLSVQEIVFSDRAAAYGAGYTDLTVRLPALQLLVALSVGVSLLLAVNTVLKGTILPIAGMGVWFAVLVLGVALLPTLVQRFQVDPSEFDREQSYIARTIDMTRQGFALDRIETQLYPVGDGTDATTVEQNPGTIENIRLWDHRPLRDVYNQIQFFRLQYSFLDIDIDRYTIDGDYRQVMVGMRELVKAQLPVTAQTWVNRKLQFTHGYGVAMSPVTEFTNDGLPVFLIKDIPPKPVAGAPEVTQPQIYFGEATDDWVIVNSRTPEFDHPTDEQSPRYTSYAGEGVKLGGYLRRLLFAWKFSDVNIFVTSEVTADSKILYYRGVQERVRRVAPFLELDRDPYAVVADGK